jgi:hypothetical protein
MAYLLESEFGIVVPKEMQREFGPLANDEVDRLGREVTGSELREIFLAGVYRADDADRVAALPDGGARRNGALQGGAA